MNDEYPNEPRLRDLPRTPLNFPRLLVMGLIRGYQKWISPTHPPNTCRFYPSCSHYTYQAIYRYGLLKGGVMGAWRLLRCNPWNKADHYDPVP